MKYELPKAPLLIKDKKESRRNRNHIKKYNKHWEPVEWELNDNQFKILKKIKDFYNEKGSNGCYCKSLACNDWDDIHAGTVLRFCNACKPFMLEIFDYAVGNNEYINVKKKVMRTRRFDNIAKMKVFTMIRQLREEFK